MAITIKKLLDKVKRIEAQRDALAKEAEAFRIVIASLEAEGEQATPTISPGKTIDEKMMAILREHGKPLHYKVIYERLVQRGIRVPGKSPARNVGAHLSLDKRFANWGEGLWGLREWKSAPSVPSPNGSQQSVVMPT